MPTAVQYWARVRLLQLWDNTTALYFVATDLLNIGGGVVGIIWKSRVAGRKFSLVVSHSKRTINDQAIKTHVIIPGRCYEVVGVRTEGHLTDRVVRGIRDLNIFHGVV